MQTRILGSNGLEVSLRNSKKVYSTAKKLEPQRKTTFAAFALPLYRFLKM
jgi:hypothetical protein